MRNHSLRCVVLTLVCCLSWLLQGEVPAAAQSIVEAQTIVNSNLRTGPGRNYVITAALGIGVHLYVDGRSAAADWFFVHTDHGVKGWVAARQVQVSGPIQGLPVLDDTAGQLNQAGPVNSSTTTQSTSQPSAALNSAPERYAVNLTPGVRSAMKAVFTRGRALGNRSNVFTRVGDCLSGGGWFFQQFGDGQPNNLGRYQYLQQVIDYYQASPRSGVANSFVLVSQAEHGGFTTAAVNDPTWSDRRLCSASETPLACEYRVDKPAVALIMFGVVDVQAGLTPAQFGTFLSQTIDETLRQGIIPILSTAPETPGQAPKGRAFNDIVRSVAQARNIPLINLADALSGFPDKGLDPDGIHLTPALHFTRVDFSSMKDGFTVWNFLALHSLYNVWAQIINPAN